MIPIVKPVGKGKLTLPIYSGLADQDVDCICDIICDIRKGTLVK
jgi:dTDP-4-amino-4,6-dideoxygalactose transaminase